MLSKREFAEELRTSVLATGFLEGINGANIEITEVVKGNDTVLTGLVVRDTDSDIAPCIYVENLYDSFCNGKDIDEIAEGFVGAYNDAKRKSPEKSMIDMITDYSVAKNHLVLSVVNYSMNREMLSNIPHKRVEDVALFARIEVDCDKDSYGSVKVNNELLEKYGITSDELISDAKENMQKLYPVKCMDIVDVLSEISGMPSEMFEDKRGQMYVLRTSNGINGAVYGFDKDALSDACKMMDADKIFIIPSSVNEVLVMSEKNAPDPRSLSNMITDVNNTSVEEQDVLADHPYMFDNRTRELCAIGDDGTPVRGLDRD